MAATAKLPPLPRRPTPTTLLPRGADRGTRLLTPEEVREVRKHRRKRSLAWASPLRQPLPWLTAALIANVGLYVLTVAHEAQLTRWRSQLAAAKQQNVQLRATLASARSLPWIDTRARALGLANPNAIAYLPPIQPPARKRPSGALATGAAEGF
ncbi:MAG: hypothetical protein FJZ01_24400 [Candidatus Sericytochromatia bacterium]|nr:hypothetical protein [Candidatus Tanganyikabacteria bacterium]